MLLDLWPQHAEDGENDGVTDFVVHSTVLRTGDAIIGARLLRAPTIGGLHVATVADSRAVPALSSPESGSTVQDASARASVRMRSGKVVIR